MPIIPSPYAIYSHVTSGGNIVRRALRLIRVHESGQNLSANEVADGIEALNQLTDQWNAQKSTIPALFRFEFPLVNGTQTYKIGPGTTVDIQAPMRLEKGQVYLKQTDNTEFVMECLSQEDWGGITIKSTPGRPYSFYFENLSPFGQINVYPVPNAAYSIILYLEQLLAQIVNPQAQFSLQNAYAKALSCNLAIDLASEYDAEVTPELALQAAESLADLKRNNYVSPIMQCEEGMGQTNSEFRSSEFSIP